MRHPFFYCAAFGLVVALGAAAEFTNFARSDITFLLYAAGRVLDGARLYVDLVEINPPLIIAINIVPVAVARALAVSDVLVYRLFTMALLLGSLALTARIIARARLVEPEGRRRWLLLVLAAALFLVPGIDFGQREHLLLALLLPYLFTAIARATDRPLSQAPAFATGLLAGAGLALKPHFLLLWVSLELYLRWRSRHRSFRLWPESGGAVLFLAVYVLAILLVTPEYIGLVSSVGRAYAGYLHDPIPHVLVTAPGTTVCFLGALTIAALARHGEHRQVWAVLGIALVASFLAGAAQQKGWTYHFYPATACALVVLAFASADVARPLPSFTRRLYAALATAAVVVGFGWAAVLATTRTAGRNAVQEAERAQLVELDQAVRRYAAGGSLYVFSYTIGSSFPLVHYSGVAWASRFPHLWLLEATYEHQLKADAPLRYHPQSQMKPAERYLNDAVYEDLARHRPTVVMVLRHTRDIRINGLRRLDYLGYFSRDPRIAAVLADYRFVEDVGQYRFYQRADVAPARAGPPPRVEPGTVDIILSDVAGMRALWTDTAFLIMATAFLFLTLIFLARERQAVGAGSERRPARMARGLAAVPERGVAGDGGSSAGEAAGRALE